MTVEACHLLIIGNHFLEQEITLTKFLNNGLVCWPILQVHTRFLHVTDAIRVAVTQCQHAALLTVHTLHRGGMPLSQSYTMIKQNKDYATFFWATL